LSGPLERADAELGLRGVLDRAAIMAVNQLGRTDAFMGNPKVRVVLPRNLDDAAQRLLSSGRRPVVGELVTAMNRAAEAALPDARPVLADAIKAMPVDDALKVLKDGDRAATRFFENGMRSWVAERFVPVVQRTAEAVRLAPKYENFAAQAALPGLLGAQDTGLDRYVARKALDSLFLVMGDLEARMRADPVGLAGSASLARVLRALK
jgi:hypothetical protein